MTLRPASRREHARFCEVEGWTVVRDARGRAVGHHITYELGLATGAVLRTRISRPANNERYGPRLGAHILTEQLAVTEAQFWACVDHGEKPPRPGAAPAVHEALPASLAHQLLHTVGLSDAEVAGLTREQAIARMNEYWSSGS